MPDVIAGRSEVDICNLALAAIGHTQFIGSFDEGSTEAEVCGIAYPQCRDEVLEATEMPFATRRSKPAPLDATTLDLGAVPGGWLYAFALPADCLPNGLRKIYPGMRNPQSNEEVPLGIEYDGTIKRNIVLTDCPTPEFIYTAQITDTNRFAPTFVRALIERVACELVRSIRKDPTLLVQQLKVYAAAEATAKTSGRRSQRVDDEPQAFFLAARGAGTGHVPPDSGQCP